MVNPLSGEWYLKIGSNQVGPYTVEQIQKLMEEGEIRPSNRVTSSELKGAWISTQELLTTYEQTRTEAAAKATEEEAKRITTRQTSHSQQNSPFSPPLRPLEIGKISGFHPTSDPINDPALSLFETLQAVKERKSTSKISVTPLEAEQIGFLGKIKKILPSQAWVILALTTALGLFAWGMMKRVEKNLKPITTSPNQTPQTTQVTMDAPKASNPAAAPPPSKPQVSVHPKLPNLPNPPKASIAPKAPPRPMPPPPANARPPDRTPPPPEPNRDAPDPRDEPPRMDEQRQDNPPSGDVPPENQPQQQNDIHPPDPGANPP